MTVGIAKVMKDKIILGCDTQVTSGYDKEDIKDMGLSKIYSNDKISFISSGSLREINFLRLFIEESVPQKLFSEMDYIRYMHSFEKHMSESVSNYKIDNQYIFVSNGSCFYFWEFDIYKVKDFRCIGSGSSKANMLMDIGTDIEKTLKTVCKYDLFCNEPIEILEIKRV